MLAWSRTGQSWPTKTDNVGILPLLLETIIAQTVRSCFCTLTMAKLNDITGTVTLEYDDDDARGEEF
jgi:hypothetical protein